MTPSSLPYCCFTHVASTFVVSCIVWPEHLFCDRTVSCFRIQIRRLSASFYVSVFFVCICVYLCPCLYVCRTLQVRNNFNFLAIIFLFVVVNIMYAVVPFELLRGGCDTSRIVLVWEKPAFTNELIMVALTHFFSVVYVTLDFVVYRQNDCLKRL